MWGRRRSIPATVERGPMPAMLDADGRQVACRATGCPHPAVAVCAYVDRRGHACDTSWCEVHAAWVGPSVYCRRHERTARHLGERPREIVRPEVDTRAASLVTWVADRLDAPVRSMLDDVCLRLPSGTTLIVDPLHAVSGTRARDRGWVRSWKLVDGNGVTLRARLLVRESADTEVVVDVDGYTEAALTPPWITRRRRGLPTGDGADQLSRAEFERRILAVLEAAVAARLPIMSGAVTAG